MAKSQKQVKEVCVIARYQFKADPRKVVYLVRASNGVDTYQVFFYNGKACSCGCASRKPCYHMTQLEAREAQRNQSNARGQALAAARAASEAELAKIEAETFAQIEAEQAAEPVQKSEQAKLADLPFSDDEKKYSRWTEQEMLKAPLNGSRAFSLMR